MRYVLAPKIHCDLEEIADWIARDNPTRAVTFVREIRAEFAKIALNPLLYRLRPEIGEDVRLAVIGRYVVLFVIEDEHVRFERVIHGSRNLSALYQEQPFPTPS